MVTDPCSICYQEISKDNKCVVHPCQHEFCKECIFKLKASNKFKFKCPLCRANIVSVYNVSIFTIAFFRILNSVRESKIYENVVLEATLSFKVF